MIDRKAFEKEHHELALDWKFGRISLEELSRRTVDLSIRLYEAVAAENLRNMIDGTVTVSGTIPADSKLVGVIPAIEVPQGTKIGYERFTDRARKVMRYANQEAQRFNRKYIRTDHILLGILRDGEGLGAQIIKLHNLNLETIASEVRKHAPKGPEMVTMGKLSYTQQTKDVIAFAIEEATSLKHPYIGTEHLLLGLLREPSGFGQSVLRTHGMTIDSAKAKLDEALKAFDKKIEKNVSNVAICGGQGTEFLVNSEPPQSAEGVPEWCVALSKRILHNYWRSPDFQMTYAKIIRDSAEAEIARRVAIGLREAAKAAMEVVAELEATIDGYGEGAHWSRTEITYAPSESGQRAIIRDAETLISHIEARVAEQAAEIERLSRPVEEETADLYPRIPEWIERFQRERNARKAAEQRAELANERAERFAKLADSAEASLAELREFVKHHNIAWYETHENGHKIVDQIRPLTNERLDEVLAEFRQHKEPTQ